MCEVSSLKYKIVRGEALFGRYPVDAETETDKLNPGFLGPPNQARQGPWPLHMRESVKHSLDRHMIHYQKHDRARLTGSRDPLQTKPVKPQV